MKYALILVLLAAMMATMSCQDCVSAIKKYWRCKWFTPLMIQYDKTEPYVVNSTINYDLTGEQFTLTQNLTQKYPDFPTAFAFFSSIYKEMSNNVCWKTNFMNREGVYSAFFLKKGYYDDALKIISDAKAKFAGNLMSKPGGKIADDWAQWGVEEGSTIMKFCMKNDFTSDMYDFYNTTALFCGLDWDSFEEVFFSCTYTTFVKNRKVILTPNNKALITIAQCSIAQAKDCDFNVTRFWSLTDWTNLLPGMKVPAGKNKTIAFFDSLRKGDKIPTVRNFSYMFADWSKTALNVRAHTDEQEGAGFYSCSNLTKTIIQTNDVTLSAEWGKNNDGSCYLSLVT